MSLSSSDCKFPDGKKCFFLLVLVILLLALLLLLLSDPVTLSNLCVLDNT